RVADFEFVRGFPVPTREPKMFELRFRAYRQHWQNAVDAYVQWMEKGAGFTPLEKQSPAWINRIGAQAYVDIGDFKGLDDLANQLDPGRTLIGRMVGAWTHPMDVGYPDYTLNETAKQWIKRARELGFHVGVHFNTNGISKDSLELIKRFHDGLLVTGKDENGAEKYFAVDGEHRHVYCSAAYQPWRL